MNLTEFFQEIFFIVLTVLLPVIVKYAAAYLKSLQINTNNETLNSYITSALELITDIVVSVNQTYVDSLKASGEFTEEAQETAFEKAKTAALSLISEEMKSAIEIVYGNFEEFITTQIEAAVNYEKAA